MNHTPYLLMKPLILFCIIFNCKLFAQIGFKQSGMASYYGKDFQGKKTACGEIFNKEDYTAAHPTLPYNAILRVTNLRNRKQVYVRVNDRGPYSNKRIVDLSRAAAKKIDLLTYGTTKVNIEVISLDGIIPDKKNDPICLRATDTPLLLDYSKLQPERIYKLDGTDTILNGYGIQMLSVHKPENLKVPNKIGLRDESIPLFVEVTALNNVVLYRLLAGNFNDRSSAQQEIARFKKMGYDCFIKKHINVVQ